MPTDWKQQLGAMKVARQRCRVDLLYLCQVIGYRDVNREVHGEIIDKLQHFTGGEDNLTPSGFLKYTPKTSLWDLTGPRRQLYLDPRGHLKTTIITQAHSVQWILNYPDIRVLITTATADLSEKVLRAIKASFQFNEEFRALFPEYCPPDKKAGEWGNLEAFTVPNRSDITLREPTCSTSSVGKAIAGSHYDVMIDCDMVDKENVRTPGGIREVIEHHQYMDPLLERHPSSAGVPGSGWRILEGTRYDFGDLYGWRIDKNPELPTMEQWQIHCRTAEKDPTTETSLWPGRFPWSELKAMERTMGPGLYSAQMLNRPIPASGGLANIEDLANIWLPRREVTEMLPTLSLHCTVDMAAMDEKKVGGDYIVLTVAGFDRQGRMVIVDIRRGHYTETETINQFYYLARMYPTMQDFKIEKEAYWRTLAPFLKREQFKRGWLPPIIDIKRDNRVSKEQRIRGLQPWFKAGLIRISADIPSRLDLVQEITRFPSRSVHDDILDTIADQLQNREGGVNYDVVPAPWEPTVANSKPVWEQENAFIGFSPLDHEAQFIGQRTGEIGVNFDSNGI